MAPGRSKSRLAAELDKTFPLDTLVQRYWLPTIRAGLALERKDPHRAVELLKAASTIELGQPTGLAVFLCPVYLRGEAYLMLHDGNAAAEEFRKFVEHRGLVVNFPWGAVAQLGLARAYTMQGETIKAHIAYQDFLTLRRRPRHPHPEGSQSGVREAAVKVFMVLRAGQGGPVGKGPRAFQCVQISPPTSHPVSASPYRRKFIGESISGRHI